MSAPWRGRDAVFVALASAVGGGLVRALGLGAAYLFFDRYVHQAPRVVWTAPVSLLLLIAPVAVVAWLLGARIRALRTFPGFLAAVAWLPATSVALDVPGLHPLSALAIGIGLGVVAGRIARRWPDAILRLVRGLAVGLTGATLIAGVAVEALPRIREARARSTLPAARAGAPNVLLIILDTVRAMSLSAYGLDRPTSPNLTQLASRGVRFAEAYSPAPWTLPSHESIMTGRWAFEVARGWDHPMTDQYPTLAEVLTSRGFVTAGFTGNLANTSSTSGLARGFQHYEDYPISFPEIVRASALGARLTSIPWLLRLIHRENGIARKSGTRVSAEFLHWLDHKGPRPFFVFLNFFDAHDPYEAPAHYDSLLKVPSSLRRPDLAQLRWTGWDSAQVEHQLRAYEAAIAATDAEVGRLLAELERRGALANTLVIVTADHGEEFYEHELMRHGNSLYRPSVQVPLILSAPSGLPRGVTVTTPVSLRDLAATIAAFTGNGDAGPFPGQSLLTRFGPNADSLPDPIVVHVTGEASQPASFPVHWGPLFGVLDDGFWYFVDRRGHEELYENSDYLQRRNLSTDATEAPTLADLRARLGQLTQGASLARPRQ